MDVLQGGRTLLLYSSKLMSIIIAAVTEFLLKGIREVGRILYNTFTHVNATKSMSAYVSFI